MSRIRTLQEADFLKYFRRIDGVQERNNTYMGHDNVLIHVIEHDVVATLDILYEHSKTGKWSNVLNV